MRIAVLRFENLSADASLDWAGRGLSEVLVRELSAIPLPREPFAPHLASAPGVSSEYSAALQAGAGRLITGYYTVSNGKLAVTAIERDSQTQKVIESVEAAGDTIPVADTLARHFKIDPQPSPTRSEAALRDFCTEHFEQATQADPHFGDSYLAWSRAAAEARDTDGVRRAIQAGLAQGNGIAPLDRAYLQLEAANLQGNRAARLEALASVVKLTPGDAANLRLLADSELAARRFAPAIEHYQQAAALTPTNADLWNLLAYARAFAGDSPGALQAIREYQKRVPDDPNGIDSEGDIDYYFGRFADAEKSYLQAYGKAPEFQGGIDGWKAARARLAAGDAAGATMLFRTFETARGKAGDPSSGFRAAEWSFTTGDTAQGMRAMAAAGGAAQNPDVRSLCYTQAAIWEISAGHATEAKRLASLALRPPRPTTLTNAAIVSMLAQMPLGAQSRPGLNQYQVQMEIPNAGAAENLARIVDPYADLVAHRYEKALPEWKALWENSNPTDQQVAFLYAKAAAGAGRAADVSDILKTYPIPGALPAATWECLYLRAGIPERAK